MKWEHLARKITVTAFRDRNANLIEVNDAGVKLIAAMYQCDINLNRERARMFNERCNHKARKKKIYLERLPPTTDAAQLHAERAYLQVQVRDGNPLNPESFGWHMVDGILEPIPMRQEPAPHFLMEVKKCGCKSVRTISVVVSLIDYLDMI